MCGIAGLIASSPGGLRDTIGAMCRPIRHRGPDGEGVTVSQSVGLGMCRLAIVDVEHGHQPMQNEDASVALVYNGEIYNAPALREELQAEGVSFRTRSDTEVILRLYERNPDNVEEKLAGMWAFAIHDLRRKRVVLSRDRFGIKPLFVADTGTELAFASELRSFGPVRDRPSFAPLFRPSASAAHAMLSWAYVPELETIYEGVVRLSPGTRLEVPLDGRARATRRYWALRPSMDAARVASLDDAVALIEPALRRAVREHLESDVPIAAFLSGGIDSSLVCAYAREETASPLNAFAIGFREPRFDESPHARAVARTIGMALSVIQLDEASLQAHLADALLAYDEPFGDSSGLATFALSRQVSATHKVALAGDGGDEVFAGYKKHRIVAARGKLNRLPTLRNAIGGILGRIPARTDRSRAWTDALRIARRVAQGLRGADSTAYAALTQVGCLARTAPLLRAPADARRFLDATVDRFERAEGSELQRTLACDLAGPLPNDMLTKVDRASMACHLEVRVPLLDHRLVELGVGLPSEFTLGRSGKEVLRAIFRRKIGGQLASRRKQGFGVPVETWLGRSLAPACDTLFERRTLDRFGILSSDELGSGRWRKWLQRDPQILWHAFALAAWLVAELGDGPEALRDALARGARRPPASVAASAP